MQQAGFAEVKASLEEAVHALHTADPDNAFVLEMVADLAAKAGDTAKARQLFQRLETVDGVRQRYWASRAAEV